MLPRTWVLCSLVLYWLVYGASGAIAAPPSRADAIMVYGGLSYTDSDASPTMAAFLADAASGSALREGRALTSFAEQEGLKLNDGLALAKVTSLPVISTPESAWAVLGGKPAGASNAALMNALSTQFDHVYGLVFVASFEDRTQQTLKYSEQSEIISGHKVTYLVGLDALLLEFDANGVGNIVLSASAIGENERPLRDPSLDTEEVRNLDLRLTYQKAITEAVANLRRVGASGLKAGAGQTAMVTGFTIQESTAAAAFGYNFSRKPTLEGLNRNICTVPAPCSDDRRCLRISALLQQGFTAAMSRAGLRVLPPLSSAYAGDAIKGIRFNLSVPASSGSILGAQRTIVLRPTDASMKYVVILRRIESYEEPHDQLPDLLNVVKYTAATGYAKAPTGIDGCTPSAPVTFEPKIRSLGCVSDTYVKSQGRLPQASEPAIYGLAAAQHLQFVGKELAGEKPGKLVCVRPD